MKTLEEMFDILDASRKGFLTAEQVKEFFERAHICSVNFKHVVKSIEWVVGPNGKVVKSKFSQVLQELSRRKDVEDKAQWDFIGLDKFGSSRISVSEALLLFQITHGNEFLIDFWHQFIDSRGDLGTTVPVSYDEMRMWLCDHPFERPNKDEDEPDTAEEELARLAEDFEMALDSEIAKLIQKTDEELLADRDWNEKKSNRLARRKLGNWEKNGVSGLFDDDGIDDITEDIAQPLKRGISVVFDLLNLKYDILRERVIILMAEGDMGSGLWIGSTPSQQKAVLRKISTTEKQLRRKKQLASSSHAIPGSHILLRNFDALLGKLGEELTADQRSLNIRRRDMKKSGTKEVEIEQTLKRLFEESLDSRMKCGDALVILEERQEKERKLLLSMSPNLLTESHGRLAAQITSLRRFDHPETCALSVGLLERNQLPVSSFFEADYLRQERLAKIKMNDDFSKSTDHVGDDYIGCLIKSISLRHLNEYEELLSLIKSLPEKIPSTDSNEREKKMTILQNERENLRESADDLRIKNKKKHIAIFQEACKLYLMDLTRESGILRLHTELQLQQHLDLDKIVRNLGNLNDKELKAKSIEEEKKLKQHDMDNIAAVLLNQGNISEDEKPYVVSIEVKYAALKDVAIQHSLEYEYGPDWGRLSQDEKKNLRLKRAKEEAVARERGEPDGFSPLMGKLGSKLSDLNFYMGPVREGALLDSSNILYDLTVRMRIEKEAVLNTLRKNGLNDVLLVAIRHEAWRAIKESDTGVSALSVGLVERVFCDSDPEDDARQLLLAKLRYKLRQKRLEQGQIWSREKDEGGNIDNDLNSWRRAFLIEMSKKHREEIEVILYVLQDPSMDSLVDAALKMGDIERTKRLSELSFKRNVVNDDLDQRMELIEEAAAIRIACKLDEEDHVQSSHEEIAYGIVADVQAAQYKELSSAMRTLANQDQNDLMYKRGREIDSRNDQNVHNILDVLTKYVGELSDDSILQALDDRQAALEALLDDGCPQDVRDKLKKDFEEERRLLLDRLRGFNRKYMSERERQALLMRLKRQQRQIKSQERLDDALLLLSTTSDYENSLMKKQQSERERQKELALKRLAALKAKKVGKIPCPEIDNDRRTMKDTILKLADQMFEQERQLLVEMVSRDENDRMAESMSSEQRTNQLDELYKNLRNLPPESTQSRLDLLNRAAFLKRANRMASLRRSNQESSLQDILASLLLDLEQKQNQEMNVLMDTLALDNDKDAMQEQLKYSFCIQNDNVPNLEQIICSAESSSPQESNNETVVDALKDKYDALRDTVLLDILSENDSKFDSLSKEEKNKILLELKANDSKVNELIQKGTSGNDERSKKRKNVLEDLKNDYEKEKAELLALLGKMKDKEDADRKLQLELARLRHEERLARRNDMYFTASRLLTQSESLTKNLDKEKKRQMEIAKARLEARRKRKIQGQELEEITPDSHDALIRGLETKHEKERNFLIDLLENVTNRGINPIKEKEFRNLVDILTHTWDEIISKEEGNPDIVLEKAAAAYLGVSKNQEEAKVILVANLQKQQDEECRNLLHNQSNIEKDTLQKLLDAQNNNFKSKEPIASLLLIMPEKVEDEMMKVLDMKYESMRNKILVGALTEKVGGEEAWNKLSDEERLNLLIEVKLKEKQLRKEKRLNEAEELIGNMDIEVGDTWKESKERIENRANRSKQLINQRKQEGLSTNPALIDALLDEEEIEEKSKRRRNVLEDLQMHFEEEQAALLALLKSQTVRALTEKEKQMLLARQKAEKRRLQRENDLKAAVSELLTEGNRAEQSITAERERQRELATKRLAAMRLKYRNKTKDEIYNELLEEDKKIEEEDSRALYDLKSRGIGPLHHIFMERLERCHANERKLLGRLLASGASEKDLIAQLMSMTTPSIKSDLENMQGERANWRQEMEQLSTDNLSELEKEVHLRKVADERTKQFSILKKAALLKSRAELDNLVNPNEDTEKIQQQIAISLLADLQQLQKAEIMAISDKMGKMHGDEVIRLLKHQKNTNLKGYFDNLTSLLFKVREEEKVEAGLSQTQVEAAEKDLKQEFDDKESKIRKNMSEGVDIDAELAK
ncbi:DgyrCDS7935 [Dimorphilus gyrociliatus]|nr:DgyrCDS7935 [Dimorphilus gyrociliatus]